MTPADLLVLATRPPISDEEEDERRKVARSHTSLEEMVLAALHPFFEICSRSHVKLSPDPLRKTPQETREQS